MSDFFSKDIIQLTDGVDADAEFIPLISAEEEDNMNSFVPSLLRKMRSPEAPPPPDRDTISTEMFQRMKMNSPK